MEFFNDWQAARPSQAGPSQGLQFSQYCKNVTDNQDTMEMEQDMQHPISGLEKYVDFTDEKDTFRFKVSYLYHETNSLLKGLYSQISTFSLFSSNEFKGFKLNCKSCFWNLIRPVLQRPISDIYYY